MGDVVVFVLIVVVVTVVVPRMLLRGAQRVIHPWGPRDRTRFFIAEQRREVRRRAGGRCEHHGVFRGRCEVRTGLEADHIHPWSRGGATGISNGQALCAAHNARKWAKIPFWWNIRALERRRAGYFPASEDPGVVRYGARTKAVPRRRTGRRRRRR